MLPSFQGLPVWVWVLLPLLFYAPDCVAWSALVKAICNAAGLSSSQIWIFLATALSSLACKSLIWEEWALIFSSCLSWDVEVVSFSSDLTLIEDVEMDFPYVFVECWWVPRTLASSFLNCINDTFSICSSNVLAIDVLLQSYSWLALLLLQCSVKVDSEVGFPADNLSS